MQTRVSVAAGQRLRQQLEASPALREVLQHPAVHVTRRATARTARLVAPRAADRLIADLKGTRPLLAEVRAERRPDEATVSGTGTAHPEALGTRRRQTLRIAATLSAAAVIGGLVGALPAGAADGTGTSYTAGAPVRTPLGSLTGPQVFPRPQQLTPGGKPVTVPAQVTLVTGGQADPGALAAVREVLGEAGATSVVVPSSLVPGVPVPAPAAGTLVVYLGGPTEQPDPATAQALQGLGAGGPAGLPAGGYVLATGQLPTAGGAYGAVVLAGVDATGTFYAAQSLRQLLTAVPAGQGQSAGGYGFPGLTIRDWPTGAQVRGTAESFYGTPWTTAQRLDLIDFLGRTKQNFYLYAPGDDPYRQEQWREPYPASQAADLRALAQRAKADHVTLGYAVSPSQNFCYSSAGDLDALVAKLAAMRDLGFGAFQLQFDDVSYDEWHCSADKDAFGTGPTAAAKAQARLAAAVQQRLIDPDPALASLSVVPTEFHQQGASPYRTALAAALPKAVQIAWSGVGVIPGKITAAQTAATGLLFDHPLVTMDNYPVNDSSPDRLFLGPYTGRDPEVAGRSAMLLTAAMQQPTASQPALSTAADYAWNPAGYQSDASWQYALRALAAETAPGGAGASATGGPAAATDTGAALAALTALAGNSSSSPLSTQESGYLTPLLDAFWAALQPTGGGAVDLGRLQQAADPLRAAFTTMAGAPDALRGSGPLAAETGPWLTRLSLYGKAGQAALDMLLAQHRGDGAAAWQARVQLRALRDQLAAQVSVTVGAGVLDPFLDKATQAADSWSGVSAGGLSPTTTMGSASGHGPALMTDSSSDTFYWSSAPPQVGDAIGVALGDGRPVASVTVQMGSTDTPAPDGAPSDDTGAAADDYLRDGVLEYVGDDGVWHPLLTAHEQKTITARLPDGVLVKAIRLRATKTQQTAVAVREFTVTAPDSAGVTVSGGPAAAPGSSPASVLDGDPDTAYRAAAAPTAADAPLTVELGAARPLDRLTVLTDPTVRATATVSVRRPDGSWADLGTLKPGYNELPAGGQSTDAVRLTWQPGGDAPVVNQIVPWYADTPVARLTLADPVLDVIAGAPAPAQTQAVVDALRPDGATGEITAAAPAGVPGITVAPAAAPAPAGGRPGSPVSVPRGGRADTPVQVSAAAGTPSGTYQVPVDFTAGSVTIQQTLQVHVVPPTGGPDLAPGASASSSGDVSAKFPASAVNDGDPTTRWSSQPADNAWVELKLPQAAHLGEAVLHWQDAYASAYRLQTSVDGTNWTTVATVPNGHGGTETVRFDAPGALYLRMQGVSRSTKYGYSLYGIELYGVTDPAATTVPPAQPPVGVPLPTPTPGGVPGPVPSGTPTPPVPVPTPVPSPSTAPSTAPSGTSTPAPGPSGTPPVAGAGPSPSPSGTPTIAH
ncbi:beta-N-acetylglucosaminidase domain-containing protein [Kitasatospora sp. NBC_01287]|uniref:beta-N-acetylglucosaminidase domain-containing protein n=1 Tax=Kitasatospora sp. NBC_01287 TaxID=2903573 RepID=UPI00224D5CB1|nr:beta-N-acetylglucosaminidase domain-containing protein [Kitasatospora sp. NBC_01287]MCX4746312.1 beta-N-acetylglucosaminidase domain-containing protein [Kitasatospora sp. NBC_01287]